MTSAIPASLNAVPDGHSIRALDRPLLREIRQIVLNTSNDNFDMQHWFAANEHVHFHKFPLTPDTRLLPKALDGYQCGTIGCAIGTACLRGSDELRDLLLSIGTGLRWSRSNQQIVAIPENFDIDMIAWALGLTAATARYLFIPSTYHRDGRAFRPTPDDVVDRITEVLTTAPSYVILRTPGEGDLTNPDITINLLSNHPSIILLPEDQEDQDDDDTSDDENDNDSEGEDDYEEEDSDYEEEDDEEASVSDDDE